MSKQEYFISDIAEPEPSIFEDVGCALVIRFLSMVFS